ncbi:aspartate aminotransferase, mitochondrial-like [Cucurbita moschata]|uniref:Aspartate aminotransferase n=1 Tax=Cucurbita moschata TaxID=3662 RepID=A0A6J1GG44_CUCMO|nr:aspartate aminotransferase, mitochondrial-like [Cucurbita moschata]XP_022950911.1 aspartate aminotransferase, mitochondrial-like [Cucurbita moschata]
MWRSFVLTRRCISTSASKAPSLGWFDHVKPAPKDPIIGVTEAFLADSSPNKINLGVGAYRDDEGKPVVLQCVRDAESKISGSEFLESISAAVSSTFVEESVKLIYGKDSDVIKKRRFAGLQALSGTGACRLFAEFQRHFHPDVPIFLPEPTWSNHHNIWRDAQVPVRSYRYYHPDSKGLNFGAFMDDIKNAPESSFFLLHPCAHNPTGVDPTDEQWREISNQLMVKHHFPFFDMAYQGFASGDLEEDAKAIRLFHEDGHLVGCAQSFAKNMGLYGHRVGCLSVLGKDQQQAMIVRSQLQRLARAMYSSPPIHGVLLVSTILSDPLLKAEWIEELKVMADRIRSMRASLFDNLEKLNSPLNWDHVVKQVGMFCYSGLNCEQIDQLATDFHIYMTRDGRMSMAGVTTRNVSYIASAMHQVSNYDPESLNVSNVSF